MRKQKGGLYGALLMFDMKFIGRQHDALVDAHNTARLAYEVVRRQRAFNEMDVAMGRE